MKVLYLVKIIQVKETLEDGKLTDNMYNVEKLIQSIIKRIENNNELNYDDYKFTQAVKVKVKQALQKVNEIIKI